MSGRITVNGDLPRRTVLFDRLSEELFGGSDVAVFAKEEINSESLFIYCTLEIRPSPSDFDIRFIDTPRSADRTSVAQPAFLELWNEAVNPSQDRRMRDTYPAFSHHVDQIAVAQFVGDIPANTENNDGPIKMATIEESG